MRAWTPLIALLVAGCIRTLEGPDLGECADYPDDAYTFGQVGIGTCLASPADIQFVERDGRTWLAVSNADTFVTFGEGSLLLIDWDSMDFSRRINLLHDLQAHATPTDPFNGEFGWLDSRGLAVVTNRFSPDAATRSADDRAFIIDASDPSDPVPFEPRPVVQLEDDPNLVQVDPDEGIVYVGNITDHSITLLDGGSERLRQIPVHAKTEISPAQFFDHDASSSLASLAQILVLDEQLIRPDLWTLTYVDKLIRLWAPTPNDEGQPGLARWTSGDLDYERSGFGLDLNPADSPLIGEIRAPMIVTDGVGPVSLFYSDGGVIQSLVATSAIADWQPGTTVPFAGGSDWDLLVSGPALTPLSAVLSGLYYHGRTTEDEAASIGLALSDDGIHFNPTGAPLITDPSGQISYEDPYIRADGITQTFRMWMGVFDGGQWTIGLTESLDGMTWDPVETVLALPSGQAAAPVVTWLNGRYLMWLTVDTDDGWAHATSWSYDGRDWTDPIPVVPSEVPFELASPPRAAVQASGTGAWRMEGRDQGVLGTLAFSGTQFVSTTQALALSISSGQEVDNTLLPSNRSTRGILPGSVAEVGGSPALYVTAIGMDGRERLGLIRQQSGRWSALESDLIPAGTGGNVAGVGAPVVVPHDGGYVMFYAATNAEGVSTIRRATSADGRTFNTQAARIVTSGEDWDRVEQRPHSLERMANGRVRLWYSGFDGSRWRIGAATAATPAADFSPEAGPQEPWMMGSGVLGSVDASGVRDPMVFEGADGTLQMYYSGFDGERWHIGHATLQDGEWVRRMVPGGDATLPAMSGQANSFSSRGVLHPVLGPDEQGDEVLWYAGTDGNISRLGRAIPDGEVAFAAPRFPTPGDTLQFSVRPGDGRWRNIQLAQSTADFQTTGVGMASMTLDPDRGFLYVTSKLANFVYVIDVRDDTSGSFNDANFRDIETLIFLEMQTDGLGFRGAQVDTLRDRLYLTSRRPESVVVVDLNDIEDTDAKTVTRRAATAVFPLLSQNEDAGVRTLAEIGGNGMAMTPDGRLLLVTHLRGNALYVFDLTLGPHGEQVAYIPHVGENPHMVRVSPDGRHAVVANYLGDVGRDDGVSSTLAVVDLDPDSPTYLEIVTWIANR